MADATLEFRRSRRGGGGWFSVWHVDIDGRPRLRLGRWRTRRITLPPGRYTVRVRTGWDGSLPLVVEASADQKTSVEAMTRKAAVRRGLIAADRALDPLVLRRM